MLDVNKTMKSTLIASLLFMLFSSITLQAEQTLKIAVVAQRSGQLAYFGIPIIRAVTQTIDSYNNNGGSMNRKIELIIEDDFCDPGSAISIARRNISKGFIAVIGHMCSRATISAMELYSKSNIVVVSASSTRPSLTEMETNINFLRTIPTDRKQGETIARFASETLGARSVVVIHDGSVYGHAMATYISGALTKLFPNVAIKLFDQINTNDSTPTEIAKRIVISEADAALYGGFADGAISLYRALRGRQSTIPIIGGGDLAGETFLGQIGEDASGLFLATLRQIDDYPSGNKIVEEYSAMYHESPNPYYACAYVASICLTTAIDTTRSDNPSVIVSWLKSHSLETPFGNVGFTKSGDVVSENINWIIYTVVNGKLVLFRDE